MIPASPIKFVAMLIFSGPQNQSGRITCGRIERPVVMLHVETALFVVLSFYFGHSQGFVCSESHADILDFGWYATCLINDWDILGCPESTAESGGSGGHHAQAEAVSFSV